MHKSVRSHFNRQPWRLDLAKVLQISLVGWILLEAVSFSRQVMCDRTFMSTRNTATRRNGSRWISFQGERSRESRISTDETCLVACQVRQRQRGRDRQRTMLELMRCADTVMRRVTPVPRCSLLQVLLATALGSSTHAEQGRTVHLRAVPVYTTREHVVVYLELYVLRQFYLMFL